MIVQCPACSARYKINEAKIRGRGAKITCLKCSHKFVVLRPQEPGGGSVRRAEPTAPASAPRAQAPSRESPTESIRHRDFREVGITWKVRKGIGLTYDFHDLDTLLDYLEDEQVDPTDHLSYDARNWDRIASIPDLSEHFQRVWADAEAGRIQPGNSDGGDMMDEDEADAPTTIVRHGSSLRDDIRRAVLESSEPPSPPRQAAPEPTPSRREEEVALAAPPDPQEERRPPDAVQRPDPPTSMPEAPPQRTSSQPLFKDAPEPTPRQPARPPPTRPAAPSGGIGTTLLLLLAIVVLLLLLAVALGWLPMPNFNPA